MLEQSVDSRGGGDEGADRSAYEIPPIKERESVPDGALSLPKEGLRDSEL
jgi:hypothetical protein